MSGHPPQPANSKGYPSWVNTDAERKLYERARAEVAGKTCWKCKGQLIVSFHFHTKLPTYHFICPIGHVLGWR
jgi:hypothetical protein